MHMLCPTALGNSILEVHSEEWLKQTVVFMTYCERHKYSWFSRGINNLFCSRNAHTQS